ncbi:MAG: hypothetical protein RBR70_05345 [Arcobacter sp.]|jgi:hypothetical protein|uniref:hypothetical protein n=1 Tax=Arcobacter sp. TaxID=1872629 RepID=UPI002A751762|nr:hypothetical protein [Arcobacter sp.]MDY3204478.1 hypothetical protein [Arcobacter sp.]
MKKYLFFLIISISFLKADTVYLGNCISKFYIKTNAPTKLIYLTYASGTETSVAYSDAILNQLVSNLDKFEYSIQALPTTLAKCSPITKNNTLGLSNEQFNFLSGLTGLLTAVLLVFVIYKKV